MAVKKPRVTDKGYEAAVSKIMSIGDSYVLAGVPASKYHTDPETGRQVPMAAVAAWNEYGTRTAPARSFVRATVDARRDDILDVQTKVAGAVANGQLQIGDGLSVLGQWVVGAMQARITDGIPPPNAPSTIERKGSSRPLIDSGQLRQAITFKSVLSGPRPERTPDEPAKPAPRRKAGKTEPRRRQRRSKP